jgi:hypothetical protein
MIKNNQKKLMFEFAKHCMMQLVKTPPEKTTSGMSEISSYNLYRIHKILGEYGYYKLKN